MSDIFNVPNILTEENSVFHYTKMNTALEKILFYKSLKFTKRQYSNDPIENVKPRVSTGVIVSTDLNIEEIFQRNRGNLDFALERFKHLHEETKQICFCTNTTLIDRLRNSGEYGFIKPRMWDQYGENYSGVCLSFSRGDLEKTPNIKFGDIKYESWEELSFMNNNINPLHFENDPNALKVYEERINNNLFKKHIDYQNENEFRLTTDDPRLETIDVSKSLNGIIIWDKKTTEYQRKHLKQYSVDLKIPMCIIYWDGTSYKMRVD